MGSLNERDFDLHPYSEDESRVAAWFSKRGIGGGDDPIGSLIASHELVLLEAARLREKLNTSEVELRNAELLPVLEHLLIEIGEGSSRGRAIDLLPGNIIAQARAAIARAKGEQS